MKQKSKKSSMKRLEALKLGQTLMSSKQQSNLKQEKIPSMSELVAKIKRRQQSGGGKLFPMPYEQPQRAKNGKIFKIPDTKVGKNLFFTAKGELKLKKRIQPNTQAVVTYNVKDKKVKNVNLKSVVGNGLLNITKGKDNTTLNYSKKLLDGNLSINVGASKGKNNKSVGFGITKRFKTGDAVNSSCPYRENGVRTAIKGIKPVQVKGVKFTGVK
jgi:hypothetical protein